MKEVISNDFTHLNRAVLTESSRSRTQLRLFNSKTFLNVSLGVSLILLACACAWYIYKRSETNPEIGYVNRVTTNTLGKISSDTSGNIETELPLTMLSTTEENLQIRRDLISIQQRDETVSDTDNIIIPPEKTYNAFTSISTETGETITTGRVFLSGQWDTPVQQYCYLDLRGFVGGTPLITINVDGQTVVETDDETLIDLASRYCRFE